MLGWALNGFNAPRDIGTVGEKFVTLVNYVPDWLFGPLMTLVE